VKVRYQYWRAVPEAEWPEAKFCNGCQQERPLTAFSFGPAAYGRKSRCRPCVLAQVKKYQSLHPHLERQSRLRRDFGITVADFDAMQAKQHGVCAICSQPFGCSIRKRLCIDHDHKTGRVRGLLCFNCNTGLGKFSDDPGHLRRAADYLENSNR